MDSLEAIRAYCRKFGRRPLIIDTNVLLLLFIGIFNKEYIKQCPFTANQYTSNDFEILKKVIGYFKPEIIITPHILTEVSNLSKRDIKDPYLHAYFARTTDALRHCQEHYIALEKLLAIEFKVLSRFGFADMSIVEVAEKIDAVILTDESGLYEYGNYKHIPTIKFSYIRTSHFI